MYYLAIKNPGIEKCIDKSVTDTYEDGQYFSYLPDLYFVRVKLVKRVAVRCIEIPGPVFNAIIYSD